MLLDKTIASTLVHETRRENGSNSQYQRKVRKINFKYSIQT